MTWHAVLFPGVWVHELSHALGCVLSGVPVHRIEVKMSSGRVVHAPPTCRGSVLIGLAPLVIGTFLALFAFSWGKAEGWSSPFLALFWGWLGFAIAFHSIPSYTDMRNIPATAVRRMGELWTSNHSLGRKLVFSPGYGGAWVGGWMMAIGGMLVNTSVLFRILWG
ncbi:MAG: metalloprotease family protein, partial [archaeon]|nr:metalloprotease family protein [archaeon]